MPQWQYTKGLHDLGNGCYAYLQPNGGWGWSNAGLIVDGKDTLLVDTLFDLALTREMLAAMKAAVPQSAEIGTLVNTHGNPDHTFGNQLVAGARIIAAEASVEDMRGTPPEMLTSIMANWRSLDEGAAFLYEVMGRKFDYRGITLTLPTETFETALTLSVGQKEVRLFNVGPAHTRGDTLVYVPADRTVFTGDILFNEGHPIMWDGPVGNWIGACDYILGLDVETVVPGHGAVTDKSAVRALKQYFEYIRDEARKRYDAGLGWEEAARDIALDAFRGWIDEERIVANVNTLYREFAGDATPANPPALFAAMARYYFEKRACSGADCGHDHGH